MTILQREKLKVLAFIKAIDRWTKAGRRYGLYQCDCPNKMFKEIIIDNVSNGNTTSCGGPYHRTKHGMTKTPTYRAWTSMKTRCYSKKYRFNHKYAGKEITVCDRWMDKKNGFENFLEDMGPQPFKRAQSDRIDNSKSYYKENCRWTTSKVNIRNRDNSLDVVSFEDKEYYIADLAKKFDLSYGALMHRLDKYDTVEEAVYANPTKGHESKYFEYNGEKYTLKQLSNMFNINRSTLDNRLKRGWDMEKSLTTPIDISKSRKTIIDAIAERENV